MVLVKAYDYSKAYNLIETEMKNGLIKAILGMAGDWDWTHDTIWEKGEYKFNLQDPKLKIYGISYSYWATPKIQLIYKNGKDEQIDCYIEYDVDQD